MVIFIKIFGFNYFSIRFPTLLMYLLTIIVFFDLTRRIFKNYVLALGAMLLLSINPWHIILSIWSIDSNPFPPLVLFAFYFLYRGVEENKYYFVYLSILIKTKDMDSYKKNLTPQQIIQLDNKFKNLKSIHYDDIYLYFL